MNFNRMVKKVKNQQGPVHLCRFPDPLSPEGIENWAFTGFKAFLMPELKKQGAYEMMRTNTLHLGLLIVVALFVSATIVTSVCGAEIPGSPGVSLISYYPTPQAGGFAYEDYSAFSAGTPAGVNPAGDGQATSDIVTDQELIALVRSLNYPGIDKSVRVVTDQSDAGDILDIQASSEDGVLITRSPFTTRIHIGMLRKSTARTNADPLSGFDIMSNPYAFPADYMSASNQYTPGGQAGRVIPDLFEGLNLPLGPFDLPGPVWTTGGFVYPANQAASIVPLPAVWSPFSPFNPSVRPGGFTGIQFGSGPGSAFAFHESPSAAVEINSFS